jgi:hypothetical protein
MAGQVVGGAELTLAWRSHPRVKGVVAINPYDGGRQLVTIERQDVTVPLDRHRTR